MQAIVDNRRFEADALVNYPNSSFDVIFEVKYTSPKNALNRIVEGITRTVRAASIFNATGALLIVVSDEASQETIDKLRKHADSVASDFQRPPNILIVTAADFSELSPTEFLERFGLPQP
jgi:hypothetical protein